MTPNIAIVQVESAHWRTPRLWLPLFLLWIPALVLAPLVLFIVLLYCVAARVNAWRAIAALWGIVCALPGTNVHVETHDARVRVRIL